ncbi:hypothetical protein BT63DRAFT_331511 [Microthyrium microscopicum]|uniref:Spo7-domain-containing protein n=1 Tax=Microthyrium microscopicum TaxID=703497 RepID=A0A6A6U7V9_9PEZI|nr:hypothetical protein BT63DRAFT_331511 [Microthyrium microscopicum]
MDDPGLDQLVKGSPPPNVSLPSVAAAASANTPDHRGSPSPAPSDPTSLLPSSPPQIYLNLLILEASLRSQYLTLRARRRQNTFVLIILAVWTVYFIWCQFLRPRADGTGVGGSEYWLVDIIEKVALLSGVVMGLLFKLTGQWERGVRWPAKWLRTTNRGLRGMNCKVVILKGPWWRDMLSHLSFLFPLSSLVETPGSNYQFIEYSADRKAPQSTSRSHRHGKELAEEDIAPGGDYIKILLLPKHFTPEFRENWELYRAEYWDAENRRRTDLRRRFRAKQHAEAKQQSPWLWWLPGRQLALTANSTMNTHSTVSRRTPETDITRAGSARHKRATSVLKEREGSHSRSSSRSSVGPGAPEQPMTDERERRWSTTSNTSSVGGDQRRRRKATSTLTTDDGRRNSLVAGGRMKLTPAGQGRPTTPTATLQTRASNLSSMSSGAVSSGSDGDSPTRRRYGDVKREPLD